MLMLIIIANVGRASGEDVIWAAVLHRFPVVSLNPITTAGIAADAAAATAATVATAAPAAAGATHTNAASSHIQAQAIALVWLHSGLNTLGQYLRCSDNRWEPWGENWSRVRDPGDIGVG